jgi:hypothetical protein
MRTPKKDVPSDKSARRRAPAKTLEAREHQMIALAVDLAEQQLREGTASSQVITHFLQLGSTKQRLEQERLVHENALLQAKTDALQSAKHVEELYAKAIEAIGIYSGKASNESADD